VVSETEPEKKGWFARLRSKVAPTVEPPKPAEPEVAKPEPVEPAVAAEPELPAAPPPIEPAREPVEAAPEPEPLPVEVVAEKEPEVEKPEVEKKGWLSRLREGLSKSTRKVAESITSLFTKKKLDQQTLDDLEDVLIQADLGVTVAGRLVAKLSKERFGKEVTDEEVRAAFAEDIAEILQPVAVPLTIDASRKPHVVLVVGVNGSGKTTTIAKLAHLFMEDDYGVLLAAGDTFRAAAIGQLATWAGRIGVDIVRGPEGGDPAAIVFDAVKQATDTGIDALIVDTAGRLQNKKELMEELAKIRRVLGRLNPEAPHDVVLVLDATNGQNALAQIDVFKEVAGVTGLIMTKLDGTARGGVLVAAAEQYGLPIHAIGVGEKMEDLRPFDPDLVARVIAGIA
jgi:fused signal recognition particle receptor